MVPVGSVVLGHPHAHQGLRDAFYASINSLGVAGGGRRNLCADTGRHKAVYQRRCVHPGARPHRDAERRNIFPGEDATIGTIPPGKAADLAVLTGNPAQSIDAVETLEMVFKDGLGYNPVKLTQSVLGLPGLR